MTFSIPCNANRNFAFEPARTALISIDFQRDFVDPAGFCGKFPGGIDATAAIVPRAIRVLEACRAAGLHIVHTREGYKPDRSDINAMKRERGVVGSPGPLGPFLICGTPGQATIATMAPKKGEPEYDKPGYSTFHGTNLHADLQARGITHLVIMGVTTQCCVHSSLRAAVDHGYWCLTIEDCCAALEPQWHRAAIDLIYSENHLFGWVAQADALLGALKAKAA
ncbi:MAG: cysteine hydrolase [Dongiaceae bacterium]